MDMSSINLAILFGKLLEPKMKVKKLADNEEGDKNKKSIALKGNKEKDSYFVEDMIFLVHKFKRFIKQTSNKTCNTTIKEDNKN